MKILCLTHTVHGPLAGLTTGLRALGHSVTEVATPGSALPALADFEAVLVTTKGAAGTDASREVRHTSDLPLLVVTPVRDELDTITALAVGADDVVALPVSPREVDARLRSIARRVQRADRPGAAEGAPDAQDTAIVIESSGLRVDAVRHEVTRSGTPIDLTITEIRLLVALAEHRGIPQSRDVLLHQVWGHGYHGRCRIVDNAVQRLRAKIDTPDWKHIRCVRGFGYVLR